MMPKYKIVYIPDGDLPQFYPMLNFTCVSQVQTAEPWSYDWHTHINQQHEWLFVHRGVVQCWIDGYHFKAPAGTFYFVQPGQKHKELCVGGATDYFSVRFCLYDRMNRPVYVLPTLDEPSHQRLREKEGFFLSFFQDMCREVRGQRPGWKEIVETMILQKIWQVRRMLKVLSGRPSPQVVLNHQANIVEQAKHYLRSNFQRPIALEELARFCCVSYHHLEHIFKKITGVSPWQYLLALRIAEAKRLLADSDLTVYMVGEKVGFDDAGYFGRQFKKKTGLSPAIFRKQHGAASFR